ncbi:cytochrome c-type biogenesis protein, partial [Candidatus Thiosymbion oneisti]|uniref:cytochrome c-type biogenesis protein n=1 Tax=Candidatus Thiosymbion oneisti TaxID=589554 RepID=UPI00114D3C10
MRPTLPLLALLGALVPYIAGGYTLEQFTFDTPEQAADFRALLTELRCVVCQNETLAVSQADVAQIMREEVYRLVQEGKDEARIKGYLVDRYTDHVLYDPPLKPSTYLLWFGPFLLIAVGAWLLVRTLLRKRQDPDHALSAPEREQLRELLTAPGPDQDGSDRDLDNGSGRNAPGLAASPPLPPRVSQKPRSHREGVAKAPLPVSGSHAAPGNEKTQP